MSTKEYMKFYGEDKYWNMDLKKDFLGSTRSLWIGNADKYEGHIFSISSRANEEETIMVRLKILID